MKKILSALLASTGLFCSAGTARIDLISGDAGLRVVSTAAGVSGKNMNWLPPEKAKRMHRKAGKPVKETASERTACSSCKTGQTADKQTKESAVSKKMLTFTPCFTGLRARIHCL